MLEQKFLQQRIGSNYVYEQARRHPSMAAFLEAVVEGTIDSIRRYRPEEDAVSYRAQIEEGVMRRLAASGMETEQKYRQEMELDDV